MSTLFAILNIIKGTNHQISEIYRQEGSFFNGGSKTADGKTSGRPNGHEHSPAARYGHAISGTPGIGASAHF